MQRKSLELRTGSSIKMRFLHHIHRHVEREPLSSPTCLQRGKEESSTGITDNQLIS